MNGSPKSIAGKKDASGVTMPGRSKGNVGGISTPGRHGSKAAAMAWGVKNLVNPGPRTKKSPKVGNQHGMDDKNVGSIQQMAMTPKAKSGSVKGAPTLKIYSGQNSGSKGYHMGVNGPEPMVARDEAGVVKPHGSM